MISIGVVNLLWSYTVMVGYIAWVTFGACLPSKPQIVFGFDRLISFISSLSHIQRAIDGSTKKYLVAPVSNKAVVLISLLLPSVHVANNACSAKKSPGNMDDDTINGNSLLLSTTLTEVQRFLPVPRPILVQTSDLHQKNSLASTHLKIGLSGDPPSYTWSI